MSEQEAFGAPNQAWTYLRIGQDPVSNRDPHSVDPNACHERKVALCDPRVPVVDDGAAYLGCQALARSILHVQHAGQ